MTANYPNVQIHYTKCRHFCHALINWSREAMGKKWKQGRTPAPGTNVQNQSNETECPILQTIFTYQLTMGQPPLTLGLALHSNGHFANWISPAPSSIKSTNFKTICTDSSVLRKTSSLSFISQTYQMSPQPQGFLITILYSPPKSSFKTCLYILVSL